ncbi:hypothetical protein M5D96_001751, partial [Drosophila gunungcola]
PQLASLHLHQASNRNYCGTFSKKIVRKKKIETNHLLIFTKFHFYFVIKIGEDFFIFKEHKLQNKKPTTRKGGQRKQSTMLKKLLNRDVPIRRPIIQPENANETGKKAALKIRCPTLSQIHKTHTHT